MTSQQQTDSEVVIVDSQIDFRTAIAGTEAPTSVIASLCLLDVHYYAGDGRLHRGQLVVDQRLQDELTDLFALIQATRFPVAKVMPIVHYAWSDEASMADNNTSAFNYRLVARSSRLSRHATGQAIDINPGQNPVIYADGRSLPPGARYAPAVAGTLTADSAVVQAFLLRGWRWGGDFSGGKDYHHLEKLP